MGALWAAEGTYRIYGGGPRLDMGYKQRSCGYWIWGDEDEGRRTDYEDRLGHNKVGVPLPSLPRATNLFWLTALVPGTRGGGKLDIGDQ